jgi:uncharacterized protein (TIGR03437 family)
VSPPGGTWLSIDPATARGNLPGSLKVAANPSGLAPGTYIGQISLTPDNLAPVIVDVIFVIKSAPDLQLSFSNFALGGPLPPGPTAPLMVNPNPSGFFIDLNSELNWLQESPLNGQTPQTLQFQADPIATSLSPGVHVGFASAVDQFDPTNVYIVATTLTVPAAPSTLVITNASLPNGTVNQPYASTTLTAMGGSGSYTFTIPAASMPPGLTLQGAVLSGTPNVANTFTVPVTVTDTSNPPLTATKSFTITIAPGTSSTRPTIVSVGNAASEEPFIGQNAFVEIKGTNLANITRDWNGAPEFASGRLPTMLSGVSVTINGKPAYVNFISPGQINVLAPVDTASGNVQVVVNNNGSQSDSFPVSYRVIGAAFFEFSFTTGHIAATHSDNAPVGPAGQFGNSRPAAPNEVIQLWATGFGTTNPAIPDGQVVSSSRPITNTLTVSIGGVNLTPDFAGLVGAGLYQINVRIPPAAADGNLAIRATIQGVQTLNGLVVAVKR